jgi:hypothetical protein
MVGADLGIGTEERNTYRVVDDDDYDDDDIKRREGRE